MILSCYISSSTWAESSLSCASLVTSPKQGTQSQEHFVRLKRATKRANSAGCKLLGKVINGTWTGQYNLSGKLKRIPPSYEPKIFLLLEYLIFQLCATFIHLPKLVCSLVCASVLQLLTKLASQNLPGKRERKVSRIWCAVLGQLCPYSGVWLSNLCLGYK